MTWKQYEDLLTGETKAVFLQERAMTTVYAAMNDGLLIVRQRGDAWRVERQLEGR